MLSQETHVLLIEDNPGDAKLTGEALAESGGARFNLSLARQLSTGLEVLARSVPDAVLLDLGLPDSSGLATLERTRELNPQIPIVILTGLNDESLALKSLRHGAQDYLVKGHVDGRSLMRALSYAIERKRAEERFQQIIDDLQGAVDQLRSTQAGATARLLPVAEWKSDTGVDLKQLTPLPLVTAALEAIGLDEEQYGFLLRYGRYAPIGMRFKIDVGGLGLAKFSQRAAEWFNVLGADKFPIQVVDDGNGELSIYLLEDGPS